MHILGLAKSRFRIILFGLTIASLGCSSIKTNDTVIIPSIRSEGLSIIKELFEHAVTALRAKQYREAKISLAKILTLKPNIPEVYVNHGYACLGLNEYDCSRASFKTAIKLRPLQANAYYGLALTLKGKEKLESALSTMREYIRLSKSNDKYVNKAYSKIQLWEQAQNE